MSKTCWVSHDLFSLKPYWRSYETPCSSMVPVAGDNLSTSNILTDAYRHLFLPYWYFQVLLCLLYLFSPPTLFPCLSIGVISKFLLTRLAYNFCACARNIHCLLLPKCIQHETAIFSTVLFCPQSFTHQRCKIPSKLTRPSLWSEFFI